MTAPTLTAEVLRLIAESPLNLKEIADKAGVQYQNLRRWVCYKTGKNVVRNVRTLDVSNADRIYRALTGRGYLEGRGEQ